MELTRKRFETMESTTAVQGHEQPRVPKQAFGWKSELGNKTQQIGSKVVNSLETDLVSTALSHNVTAQILSHKRQRSSSELKTDPCFKLPS